MAPPPFQLVQLAKLVDSKLKLATFMDEHASVIHYSDHIVGQGGALFDKFCGAGLKGIIPRRADAKYVGSRSGSWLETKCTRRQEFVVTGWTTSYKSGGFRSLIFAVNEVGSFATPARWAAAALTMPRSYGSAKSWYRSW